MKHSIREEVRGVLALVGVVWVAFVIARVLPFELNALGVTPRTLTGLVGIPLMPLLHNDWGHLVSNTVPLAILLCLLAGSRANSFAVVLYIVLLGGGLLWVFGRPATHIGASGLVYGLIAFLLLSGILERRFLPLAISLLVGFLFGATLLSGILPSIGSQVSWDGHLFGAIAGASAAWGLARRARTDSAGKSSELSD